MNEERRRFLRHAAAFGTVAMAATVATPQVATAGAIDARLRELGIEFPPPRVAPFNFVPAVQVGNLLFLSGTLGTVKNEKGEDYMPTPGTVGLDLTVEQGYQSARQIAINHLSWIRTAIGDLDKVVRIVKMTGYVKAVPGFERAPLVLNGASDLYVQVFGPERGKHTGRAQHFRPRLQRAGRGGPVGSGADLSSGPGGRGAPRLRPPYAPCLNRGNLP
jgi:enamine deaminase RidA (YjgF/YER057c/UK114 family)